MALTATFAANFEQFSRSLERAKVELRVFDSATKGASRSLRRELESISGQRVAVEAAKMAEAVKRLGGQGGVAAGLLKLTDAELKRISASMDRAAEKAGKLGEKLPANLARMREEIAKLPKPIDDSAKKVGVLQSAFGQLTAGVTAGNLLATGIQRLAAGVGQFAARGRDVTAMRASFQSLAGGVTEANERIAEVRRSTRGLIGEFEIMQASNKATLLDLGLSDRQMGELAQTATVLGRAMGQGAAKSLDDLITALGRSSPMILDNLGLSVKVGEANEKYARALGKVASQLTEAEKKQAFMNAALDAAHEKLQDVGGLQLTATDHLVRLWTVIVDLADASASWAVSLGPVNDALERFANNAQVTATFIREGPSAALEEYSRLIGAIGPEVGAMANALDRGAEASLGLSRSQAELDAIARGLTETVQREIDQAEELASRLNALSGVDALSGAREALSDLAALGGPLKVLPSQLDQLAKRFTAAAEAAQAMGKFDLARQYRLVAETLRPIVQFQQRYNVTIGEYVPLADAAATATAMVYEQLYRLTGQVQRIQPPLKSTMDLMSHLWDGLKAPAQADQMGAQVGAQIVDGLKKAVDRIPDTLIQAFTGGGGLSGGLKAIGTDIANQIMGPLLKQLSRAQKVAVGAGATAAAAFGGAKQGGLGATVAGLTATLGGAALKASALGGALTTAGVGGAIALGAMTFGIGAAAVGLVALGRHWFGVSAEIKRAREELSKFQEDLRGTLSPEQLREAGGEGWKADIIAVRDAYEYMGDSAEEAWRKTQDVLTRAWNTDNPEQSRRAQQQIARVMQGLAHLKEVVADANGEMAPLIARSAELGLRLPDSILKSLGGLREMGRLDEDNADALERMLGSSEVDWTKMQDAAKRYGIDVDKLGKSFQQHKLTAGAQQIIDDFDLLRRGGADVGAVLFGMRDEISALITDSKKFGIEIPANMRPWIEQLIKSGDLVDENGHRITDLKGIKFGDTLATEFQKITDKLQELIDKITGPLRKSILDIPDGNFTITGSVLRPATLPEDSATAPQRALGSLGATGRWWEHWGKESWVKLHGTESVVRPDQAAAFARAHGGGGTVVASPETGALRQTLDLVHDALRTLPRRNALAVRDEMRQAAYAWGH